jgi:hypothetical protein
MCAVPDLNESILYGKKAFHKRSREWLPITFALECIAAPYLKSLHSRLLAYNEIALEGATAVAVLSPSCPSIWVVSQSNQRTSDSGTQQAAHARSIEGANGGHCSDDRG